MVTNYNLILGGNSFKLITEVVNFLYLKSLQFLGGRVLSYDHLWNIGEEMAKTERLEKYYLINGKPRSGYRVLLPFSFGPTWLFLLMQQNFMYNHNRFIRKEKCQFHSVHVF